MSCQDHELALMDVARSVAGGGAGRAAALAHMRRCPRCAAFLQDQQALSNGLRLLAATVEIPAGAGLESRLTARMPDESAVDAEPVWRSALKVAAALILIAGGLLVAWRDFGQPGLRPAPPQAGFVLWPGAAALPPFESGELVRTDLPVAVLPVLGIEAPANTSSESVKADLLVGQDGLIRAVRLAN